MERHDHDQKEWLDADLIASYDALSKSLETSFEDKYSAVIFYFVLRALDAMTVYMFIN